MTNKEKDQILLDVKEGKFNYRKSLHSEIIGEFAEIGYIKVTRTKDGSWCDITDKGKCFIKEGGFEAASKKNILEWCKEHASKIFYVALGVILTTLAKLWLG